MIEAIAKAMYDDTIFGEALATRWNDLKDNQRELWRHQAKIALKVITDHLTSVA